MQTKKKIAGVTLIELVLVIAIMTIFFAVAWPRFPTASSKNLQGTAATMAADLRYLQQEAIVTGKGSGASFYVFDNSYRLELPGENKRIRLPEGVKLEGNTSFPGNPPAVHFNNLGRPSSGGTIILKDNEGKMLYIILAPVNGRVRVSSSPPESW